MTKQRLLAYSIMLAGWAIFAMAGIVMYAQDAYTYQVSEGLNPVLEAGSFLLETDPMVLSIPGVILMLVGFGMVISGTKPSSIPEERSAT